jgi:hypothetical protein
MFNDFRSVEVIDVKSFGAKGDGSNDDTLAIQQALNLAGYGKQEVPYNPDAPLEMELYYYGPNRPLPNGPELTELSFSGRAVYFPPGLYRLTGPLNTTCEPTAHRFFPSDSASFRFRRFRPTAHRRDLCRSIPLLAILPLPFRHST